MLNAIAAASDIVGHLALQTSNQMSCLVLRLMYYFKLFASLLQKVILPFRQIADAADLTDGYRLVLGNPTLNDPCTIRILPLQVETSKSQFDYIDTQSLGGLLLSVAKPQMCK